MNQKKIFVVDDEEMIREMLNQAFTREGYEVCSAESAEQALDILKEEKIQVMFLDLKLPGMSGIDLCKKIRRDFPVAVIYAITGYVSLFELADCREAGFDDYFTKPADLSIILKAAQDAFEKIDRWKRRECLTGSREKGVESRP